MSKGPSGTRRGDRRRNARLERLRGLLPRGGAVVRIDLADEKQAIAVIGHDAQVLARKTVRVKAFRLGESLDCALAKAREKGFAQVTVACEPTGPRRLPEELDETWAHLRHLGRRRSQLITQATASAQRIRDLLSVAWPVAAETCAQPLESLTWLTAMQLVTSRCGGPGVVQARDGLGVKITNRAVLVNTAPPRGGRQDGRGTDAGDGRTCRVVGQAVAGADGNLQNPAMRSLPEPLPAAAEPGLLEEGNLPVVAGRGLVPDLTCRTAGVWLAADNGERAESALAGNSHTCKHKKDQRGGADGGPACGVS
ncbi:MAG: hypothetical protein ACRDOK_17655 [Streptosporangiaceae bacterium]